MKKLQQFMKLLIPSDADTIVDVGVNTVEYSENDNYLEKKYAYPGNITALGVGVNFDVFRARYPAVRTVSGDGTCLPFSDKSFDISYSNAVIEHVGSREKQIQFVRELRRVSRRGFLTTPNRRFPVEVHTRIPFAHLVLSKAAFDTLLRGIGKGWAAGDYMNLLSERDLHEIMADAGVRKYQLYKNRYFGLVMTFTVVWFED